MKVTITASNPIKEITLPSHPNEKVVPLDKENFEYQVILKSEVPNKEFVLLYSCVGMFEPQMILA
jgi:hypothetical protein